MRNKTKIFGIGNWEGRTSWPLKDIKVETENIKILGIRYSNLYINTINACWSETFDKIEKQIKAVTNRHLTLFQKVIMINTLFTSQVWYKAQTYPLPINWAKSINRILLKYLWGNKSNPIKFETLTLSKESGGLGLVDIYTKAKCVFSYRLMIQFLQDLNQTSILAYYNAMTINPIFKIRTMPQNVSYVNAPYFPQGIDYIRKSIHLRNFPNIKSKDIYESISEKCPPTIQQKYPFNNWKNIWQNLTSQIISVRNREILFKYLHGILPNKVRLKQIGLSASNLCNQCQVPETNKHMVYQCEDITEVKDFLIRLLRHLGFLEVEMEKLIIMDLPKLDKKLKCSTIFILSIYVVTIWYGRTNKSLILRSFICNIIAEKKLIEKVLGDKFRSCFTEKLQNLNKTILETI